MPVLQPRSASRTPPRRGRAARRSGRSPPATARPTARTAARAARRLAEHATPGNMAQPRGSSSLSVCAHGKCIDGECVCDAGFAGRQRRERTCRPLPRRREPPPPLSVFPPSRGGASWAATTPRAARAPHRQGRRSRCSPAPPHAKRGISARGRRAGGRRVAGQRAPGARRRVGRERPRGAQLTPPRRAPPRAGAPATWSSATPLLEDWTPSPPFIEDDSDQGHGGPRTVSIRRRGRPDGGRAARRWHGPAWNWRSAAWPARGAVATSEGATYAPTRRSVLAGPAHGGPHETGAANPPAAASRPPRASPPPASPPPRHRSRSPVRRCSQHERPNRRRRRPPSRASPGRHRSASPALAAALPSPLPSPPACPPRPRSSLWASTSPSSGSIVCRPAAPARPARRRLRRRRVSSCVFPVPLWPCAARRARRTRAEAIPASFAKPSGAPPTPETLPEPAVASREDSRRARAVRGACPGRRRRATRRRRPDAPFYRERQLCFRWATPRPRGTGLGPTGYPGFPRRTRPRTRPLRRPPRAPPPRRGARRRARASGGGGRRPETPRESARGRRSGTPPRRPGRASPPPRDSSSAARARTSAGTSAYAIAEAPVCDARGGGGGREGGGGVGERAPHARALRLGRSDGEHPPGAATTRARGATGRRARAGGG